MNNSFQPFTNDLGTFSRTAQFSVCPQLCREHFLFSLIASPIWEAPGSAEDTCFLACYCQSLAPWLVLNSCECAGGGQRVRLSVPWDRKSPSVCERLPSSQCLPVNSCEATHGSWTFFLVKVSSVHFVKEEFMENEQSKVLKKN